MQVNYACTVLWATLDAEAPAAWNTYGPAVIERITVQFSALLLVAVSMLQPLSASKLFCCPFEFALPDQQELLI